MEYDYKKYNKSQIAIASIIGILIPLAGLIYVLSIESDTTIGKVGKVIVSLILIRALIRVSREAYKINKY